MSVRSRQANGSHVCKCCGAASLCTRIFSRHRHYCHCRYCYDMMQQQWHTQSRLARSICVLYLMRCHLSDLIFFPCLASPRLVCLATAGARCGCCYRSCLVVFANCFIPFYNLRAQRAGPPYTTTHTAIGGAVIGFAPFSPTYFVNCQAWPRNPHSGKLVAARNLHTTDNIQWRTCTLTQ